MYLHLLKLLVPYQVLMIWGVLWVWLSSFVPSKD